MNTDSALDMLGLTEETDEMNTSLFAFFNNL